MTSFELNLDWNVFELGGVLSSRLNTSDSQPMRLRCSIFQLVDCNKISDLLCLWLYQC